VQSKWFDYGVTKLYVCVVCLCLSVFFLFDFFFPLFWGMKAKLEHIDHRCAVQIQSASFFI
jgi:hypothetical protein